MCHEQLEEVQRPCVGCVSYHVRVGSRQNDEVAGRQLDASGSARDFQPA